MVKLVNTADLKSAAARLTGSSPVPGTNTGTTDSGRGSGAFSLWERPWPRLGRCGSPASIKAAVGVKTPPTEPPARVQAVGRAQPQWERPWPRLGRCGSPASIKAAVGVKTPPTEPPARVQAVGRAQPQWERPWPRLGRCGPPASVQAAVGVNTPPTDRRPEFRPWGRAQPQWERPWPRLGRCGSPASIHAAVGGAEDPSDRIGRGTPVLPAIGGSAFAAHKARQTSDSADTPHRCRPTA
jgi:hypothetical protein